MKRKKHICLIDYDMSDWGGVEQVIENLGQTFCDTYKVSIISLCTGFIRVYDGIACHTIINHRARMREIILKGYFKLIDIINKNQVDLVIVCGTCAGLIVLMTKPFIKAKIIFADHLALRCEWDDKPIRYMRYLCSKYTDYTVTLTELNRIDYVRLFRLPKTRVCCIYNWIDPKVFSNVNVYLKSRKRIMTVGRLEHQKGYDRLIKVARFVLPKHPDWEWHLYGEGTQQQKIEKAIEKCGLGKQLILKGHFENLVSEYQNYSFFVMSSYFEGLPLALLEAKANHLPLISFDIMTGPSEMIEDGVNGYLIEDGDIMGMAQKVETLMDNEQLCQQFSEHAYDGIEKFQKQTILARWNKLIKKVLA